MAASTPRRYRPARAWLYATAYFLLCLLMATWAGTLATVFASSLVTSEQLQDPLWWGMSLLCLLVIVVAYGVIWPRGTFQDGRRQHVVLAPAYGLLWGLCQGLLFVSLWQALQNAGLSSAWLVLVGYLIIGSYNGLLHHFLWDIHVSPPHNYSEWNRRKVLLCHTPNLLCCLSYLALYGNTAVFVMLQGLALALSARAMHFPAPWDDYTAIAGQEKSLAG